ncbi:MAG: septation protein A [Pelagibacterales bacterium]|nr:septation protein A [Pelagibacterales bacterium]
MKKYYENISNFLCDYAPLLVFFISYKTNNTENPLLTATIHLIITTSIALVISYILTKKIAKTALFSGLLLAIFGSLTVILKDETFIKMKPTIINFIFSIILFYGYFSSKPFLSYILGSQIKISNKAWITLSWRWAWFFLFLAFLNEIIWRSFSTDFWVQFKVFGMMPISLIFTASQIPFMMREMNKKL